MEGGDYTAGFGPGNGNCHVANERLVSKTQQKIATVVVTIFRFEEDCEA